MTRLPSVSGAECRRALERIAFTMVRQRGSHMVLVRESPRTMVVVPDHRELDRGTLRAVLRQCGLTVEEFQALL